MSANLPGSDHPFSGFMDVDLHPYIAGQGTRLFDGDPADYALELVASTPMPTGPSSSTTRPR